MSFPLLSVLMPVYNGERFLRAAIESILEQTFRDFEFIVVDDGSRDSTPQILNDYPDPRLQVIRMPHAGLVAALNETVRHSKGVYLARMDADDLSYPDRLARQVEHLQSNPECDVVTCWSDLLDENGAVVGHRTGGVGPEMIFELAAGNRIVHGSTMIRRSALPRKPIYRCPPEDYRLWLTMARQRRRFDCVADTLYGFRSHPDRLSLRQARSQSRGIVEVQWPILEECSGLRDPPDRAMRSRLIRGWATVGGAAYCCGDRQRGQEAYQRFRQLVRGTGDAEIEAAMLDGAEALVWGGCPWRQKIALRWLEWRCRPRHVSSYRNLLPCLPLLGRLRKILRRGSCL